MDKVIIVGAGIAGLSAGIYARMSGFETEIYEMHNIPGGFSTSWSRKGYLFEGGMHWLTGSSDGRQLNALWREVGALDDSVNIYNRDPFMTYVCDDGRKICLYRNTEKLRAHLMEISPEDKKAIDTLCDDIKKFSVMEMPSMDVKGVKTNYEPQKFTMGMMLKMMPVLPRIGALGKISVAEYTAQFQHDGIRTLLENCITEGFSASSLLFTLATLAAGDGGYPEGGSLKMAARMAEKFLALGGKIHYKTKVERVIVEDGKAVGVVTAGGEQRAESVMVTLDAMAAVDRLFERPLGEEWVAKMKAEVKPVNCTFISLGIGCDLSHLPENFMFSLAQPITYAGFTYTCAGLNNYASFKGYAPAGKTAATLFLAGDSYDYWSAAKADGSYAEKKRELGALIVALLEKRLPEIAGKVEVVDVATPLTYERYCGSWRGSWMTVMAAGAKQQAGYPIKSQSVAGLYFAGQRMSAPGGLPVALSTGRTAVQHLCVDRGAVFCNH